MGLTERHWFENEDVPENYEWALEDAVYNSAMLKEREAVKQKMWNALYAKEDELEKKFIGTDDHDAWFYVYRPWLQRGFGIAIKVFADQEVR